MLETSELFESSFFFENLIPPGSCHRKHGMVERFQGWNELIPLSLLPACHVIKLDFIFYFFFKYFKNIISISNF